MERNDDIILIVGAGITGLYTAYELKKAGIKVKVIEARNRVGGRIHTLHDTFSLPVDLGAEFVHGELEDSLRLLDLADADVCEKEGDSYIFDDKGFRKTDHAIENLETVLAKLRSLKEDMPLSRFIENNLSDECAQRSLIRFAANFDLADPRELSSFALCDELSSGGIIRPYQVNGRYQRLIDYLIKELHSIKTEISLSETVKKIEWSRDNVSLVCSSGEVHTGSKVIITVPVGVLCSAPDVESAITFSPGIHPQLEAFKKIGYGAVVKVILEFNRAFWESLMKDVSAMGQLNFLFSESTFSVWWTQDASGTPILTAWSGGLKAEGMKHCSDELIVQMVLKELSEIVKRSTSEFEKNLVASAVGNWTADIFSRGGYSYKTLQTSEARKFLSIPVEDTLYFAGEGVFEGDSIGTVEAALQSSKQVVRKVLGSLKRK